MKIIILFCSTLALVLLAGCVSLGPEPDTSRFYLLSVSGGESPSPAAESSLPLYLSRVSLPGYLQQRDILTRRSQHEVIALADARWADDLEMNVTRVLAQSLGQKLGTSTLPHEPGPRPTGDLRVLRLSMTQFEALPEGVIGLEAQVSVRGREETLEFNEVLAVKIPENSRSPEIIVAAMSEALSELAGRIAARL